MNELDKMEADAIRMLELLQAEHIERCLPYVKIISDIRAIRPQTFYADGSLMIPIATPAGHPSKWHPGLRD